MTANLPRLAKWLRTMADRIDDRGAPKRFGGHSFTFETGEGVRFRDDGKGCPLAYMNARDYERAHDEADSNRPDPFRQAAMDLLDALDSGADLPQGWTLGNITGRETGRG